MDLTDEQMMATGEELDIIRSRLDPDGWNTEGGLYPNTIIRAWMCMSLIRDEILELSLGPPNHMVYTLRE